MAIAVSRFDSLSDSSIEVSDSQKAEIRKRLMRYDQGKTKVYTWDEVKSEIRSL